MVIESAAALVAAARARSPAMLAFGSDSVVELLSAVVVLLQFSPRVSISERLATKSAAILLFSLAAIVAVISMLSFVGRVQPESTGLGFAITALALVIMPVLGWLKRRESRRLNNAALAADAVQSTTCAYLAAITLAGVGLNTALHIGWVDSLAAMAAVPILVKEGRAVWRGQACHCH